MTKEINNSPVTVEEAVAARPDYENEIIAVVRGTASPKAAQQKLEDYHGNDIAQAMASLTLPERKKLFRICTADMLAEAFEHLEEEDAVAYFNEMDVQKASAVTEKLDAETAVDILHGIEKEKRALIIDALPQDVRRDIRLLASFDEDEIGSKMTTDCVVLRENLSVPEAMAELVRQAEENDNIATIFVVDEDDEFYGAMELRDLITAKKETPLDDLIVTSFPYVYAHESIDDCIEKLKDYSEASVPVLDNGNKFLGIITAQSVIEVVDDEMGEDYAKLAGLTAEEDLKEPLLRSMQKRLPWLFALLGLGILVSTVVGAFEAVVQSLTMIMAFQSDLRSKDAFGFEGEPCGLLQRTAARRHFGDFCGLVYRPVQAQGLYVRLFGFGLYRHFAGGRHGDFQHRRHADSAVLQKNQGGSGGRVRSADYDHQRPCGGRDLLRAELGAADKLAAIGELVFIRVER